MKRAVAALLVATAPFVSGVARAAPADESATPLAATAEPDRIRTRATGFSTTALGMPGLDFVNELAGARFEFEYTPRFALGLSLAYANLKGKDGRVSNVLPEASLAYRAPLGDSVFSVPLRLSGGYLAKNGPTLRFSTGFDIGLGDALALELELLEPMVWVAYDKPELSLNFGIGLAGRF